MLRAVARQASSGGGTAGSPSNSLPFMDGVASAGVANLYSRGDHVHPTDTTRLPLAGGTMTGPITLAANAASALQPVTLQQLNASLGTYLPLAGGTLAGPLVLAADPTVALGAATKQYVDAVNAKLANYLPLIGGTLTGALTLVGNAASALQAVPLQQLQTYLPLAGGTLSGPLVLNANAAAALNPVPLQQLNSTVAGYLPLAGGTLTGALTLSANAASALQPVALQQMNAALGGYLPLTGGTLTGALTMIASPFTISGAAGTYRYMDFATAGSQRWQITADGNSESGSNVGSNLTIARCSDAGVFIDNPIVINRSTGYTTITPGFYVGSNGNVWQNSNGTSLVIGTANGGGVIPSADNWSLLGSGADRWIAVWAVNGAIQTSDERDKEDIQPCDLGLAFINQLAPVRFKWTTNQDRRFHYGIIAQDLLAIVKDESNFGGLYAPATDEERFGLNYDELIAPLITAVQQLASRLTLIERSLKL